jgi:hypothetical protein
MVGDLAAEVSNRCHAEPGDLYDATRDRWWQRPNLPNSGHCAAVYVWAGLYVGSGGADDQLSLVVPLKGTPIAEFAH